MKVRSVAVWNGGKSEIEVELDADDMQASVGAKWDEMSLAQQWKAISNRADSLVVEYMARRGEVTKEWATQRIKEING